MYYPFYICVDLLYTNEVLLHFDLSWHIYSCFSIEESLRIPKGKSEAVNRRTDNTLANRKRTRTQTKMGEMHENLSERF